jgi:hypothetical protein
MGHVRHNTATIDQGTLVDMCQLTFSILRTTSMPSPSTRPNTTCFWSSQSALAQVTKNWHPLVSFPLLACGSRL